MMQNSVGISQNGGIWVRNILNMSEEFLFYSKHKFVQTIMTMQSHESISKKGKAKVLGNKKTHNQ